MSEHIDQAIPPFDMPQWHEIESIVIQDCHESLVPVSISGELICYPAYYKMGVTHALPECYVREQVFDKLLRVANGLPKNIRLVVLDGWRPFVVQQYLYDTLVNILKRREAYKASSYDELASIARTLVSPPSSNPLSPSPHLTGGSVDVTLCDREGRLLDMGTLFDENSPLSWTDALESQDGKSYQTALYHRRLLFNAMTGAGFTNLPSEWWHYDYGNQLWANYTRHSRAIYGVTRPIAIERLWNNYQP